MITLTNLTADGEKIVMNSNAVETHIVCRKDLSDFLRKDLEYPHVDKAENKILVANLKSSCLVQILWNLKSCDFNRPVYVCLGWKLV